MLCVFLVSPLAMAQEDTHLIAFSEGRYGDAAAIAQDTSSADGLAFAARSLLAEAMSASDYEPPSALIEEAEQHARAALQTDPAHIEARLQLAIALSLRARPLSTRDAMRAGDGEEAKYLAESVLADDPDNPYAHGFLAVWHAEVRRRGGAIGAAMVGASMRKSKHHYRAAISAKPGDASIHWQYARALAALNVRKYSAEINSALDAAIAAEPETTLERTMQARARIFLGVFQNEDRKTIERTAKEML